MQYQGRAWKYGNNVNTDVIFPGKYTYTVTDVAEMAKHALEDLDPSFAANVKPGDIVVGGTNWGNGSSREQAVTCLVAAGVQLLVGICLARVFLRYAVNGRVMTVALSTAVASIPG